MTYDPKARAEDFIELAQSGKYKWNEPRTESQLAHWFRVAYEAGQENIRSGIRDLLNVPPESAIDDLKYEVSRKKDDD